MAFPISVAEDLVVLPALVADSSKDILTANLTIEIGQDATKIRRSCEDHGYNISSPNTFQTRLLSLFNTFYPQSRIVLRRGGQVDPDNFLRFVNAYSEMATYLKEGIRAGWFDAAFQRSDIPAQRLATYAQCDAQVPSFESGAATHPTSTVVQYLADYWAAFVYAIAANTSKRYLTPVITQDGGGLWNVGIDSLQLDCYRDIVTLMTGSMSVRVRAAEFKSGSRIQHALADDMWAEGKRRINSLQAGDNLTLFN